MANVELLEVCERLDALELCQTVEGDVEPDKACKANKLAQGGKFL